MQLIFSGPRRQAAILARMLRAQHLDAVMMFTQHEGEGSVYIPGDEIDVEDRAAIERAIEASEIEHEAEGGV